MARNKKRTAPKPSKIEQARAGLAEAEANFKRGMTSAQFVEYARGVVAGCERLEAEKDALRTATQKAPAAFGHKPIPDTDLARAARRQNDIAKGKFIV